MIWKKNKTTQFLLANYRPMKCTEDICVFSKGGAAAASRHKGNMTYNPQNLQPVNIKKKNSKERIGKMLNQSHHYLVLMIFILVRDTVYALSVHLYSYRTIPILLFLYFQI